MPGHGGIAFFSQSAPSAIANHMNKDGAHHSLKCPYCGEQTIAAVIAKVHESGYPSTMWLRCTACHQGLVINNGDVQPPPAVGESVIGLPAEVEHAYGEARRSASVAAYTASELMCRKILMHVAVDKGADPGKSFASYIQFLINEGYLTPPMKPWADLIRQHANVATHQIPPSDKNRALGTLSFTAQLLRLVYEMDHKVSQFMVPPAADTASE